LETVSNRLEDFIVGEMAVTEQAMERLSGFALNFGGTGVGAEMRRHCRFGSSSLVIGNSFNRRRDRRRRGGSGECGPGRRGGRRRGRRRHGGTVNDGGVEE